MTALECPELLAICRRVRFGYSRSSEEKSTSTLEFKLIEALSTFGSEEGELF